jgi:hypothetical protein
MFLSRCNIHSLVFTESKDEISALCLSKFSSLKQGGYCLYYVLERLSFLCELFYDAVRNGDCMARLPVSLHIRSGCCKPGL